MNTWLTKVMGFAKYAGAAALALGVAVLFRRSPVANPKQDKIEKGPDPKIADDNAVQLEKKQEEIKEQHEKIEEVLQPKPQKDTSLQDAVNDWNRGT